MQLRNREVRNTKSFVDGFVGKCNTSKRKCSSANTEQHPTKKYKETPVEECVASRTRKKSALLGKQKSDSYSMNTRQSKQRKNDSVNSLESGTRITLTKNQYNRLTDTRSSIISTSPYASNFLEFSSSRSNRRGLTANVKDAECSPTGSSHQSVSTVESSDASDDEKCFETSRRATRSIDQQQSAISLASKCKRGKTQSSIKLLNQNSVEFPKPKPSDVKTMRKKTNKAWAEKQNGLFRTASATLRKSDRTKQALTKTPKTIRKSNSTERKFRPPKLTEKQRQRIDQILQEFSKKKNLLTISRESAGTFDKKRGAKDTGKGKRKKRTNSEANVLLPPTTPRGRSKSKTHANVIVKTLQEFGDGSTLADIIDYSKGIFSTTQYSTLLVLHALKQAIKNEKVSPFMNMFVRTECYEEFVEDEVKRKQQQKKLTKQHLPQKVPLKSSLKRYRNAQKKAGKSTTNTKD